MNPQLLVAGAFAIVAIVVVVMLNRPDAPPAAPSPEQERQARAAEREAQRKKNAERAATRKLAADAKAKQRVAQEAAEETRFGERLATPARWKALGPLVRDVLVDAAGRAWFGGDWASGGEVAEGDAALKRTVEAAAAGGPPIIRGGRLLLVDRAGRFWVVPEANPARAHELLCYDGKAWSETRLASGEEALPPKSPMGMGFRGQWYDCGFGDSSGNLYFIGGSTERTGIGVHRRTRDGQWSVHVYVPPRKSDNLLGRHVQFFEQSGGRVVIYPRNGAGGSDDPESRVLRFDGKQWETIDPRVCGAAYHGLRFIAPMPDGSIATVCESNRLAFRWPEQPREVTPQQLKELLDDLDASDPKVREQASQTLVERGKYVADHLAKLDLNEFPPEVRVRLQRIQNTFATGGAGTHDEAALYGGRYSFELAHLVAQRPDGALRLYLDHCSDTRDDKVYHHCFATLDTKGQWTIEPIPPKQWESAGAPAHPQFRFIDSHGGVWLRECMRTEPDHSAVPVAPDGLTFKSAVAEDKAGRVYVKGDDGYHVFDPAQPQAKGELAEQSFQGLGHVRGDEQPLGWGVKDDVWPNELLCYGRAGGIETLPREWDDAGIGVVYPLKGFAVLISLRPRNPAKEFIDDPWRLWDGKAWHKGGPALRDFAIAHADRLLPLVPQRVESYGQGVALGADGAGGLWLWHNANWFDGQRQQFGEINVLEHFDGKQWHDVWPAIGVDDPIARKAWPIGSAARGAAVLLHDRRQNVVALVRRDGAGAGAGFKMSRLAPAARNSLSPIVSGLVETPDGDVWYRAGEPDFHLTRLRGEQLETLAKHERPLLADRDGTVWILPSRGSAVRARVGKTWIELPIEGLARAAAMTQSPDGRIWLLHGGALSELRVDRAAGKIAEAGRWKWATPMNDFRGVFCDAKGGLWIAGHGNRHTRFQLPPASR